MYYITYNRQLLDYAEKEEISRIEGMIETIPTNESIDKKIEKMIQRIIQVETESQARKDDYVLSHSHDYDTNEIRQSLLELQTNTFNSIGALEEWREALEEDLDMIKVDLDSNIVRRDEWNKFIEHAEGFATGDITEQIMHDIRGSQSQIDKLVRDAKKLYDVQGKHEDVINKKAEKTDVSAMQEFNAITYATNEIMHMKNKEITQDAKETKEMVAKNTRQLVTKVDRMESEKQQDTILDMQDRLGDTVAELGDKAPIMDVTNLRLAMENMQHQLTFIRNEIEGIKSISKKSSEMAEDAKISMPIPIASNAMMIPQQMAGNVPLQQQAIMNSQMLNPTTAGTISIGKTVAKQTTEAELIAYGHLGSGRTSSVASPQPINPGNIQQRQQLQGQDPAHIIKFQLKNAMDQLNHLEKQHSKIERRLSNLKKEHEDEILNEEKEAEVDNEGEGKKMEMLTASNISMGIHHIAEDARAKTAKSKDAQIAAELTRASLLNRIGQHEDKLILAAKRLDDQKELIRRLQEQVEQAALQNLGHASEIKAAEEEGAIVGEKNVRPKAIMKNSVKVQQQQQRQLPIQKEPEINLQQEQNLPAVGVRCLFCDRPARRISKHVGSTNKKNTNVNMVRKSTRKESPENRQLPRRPQTARERSSRSSFNNNKKKDKKIRKSVNMKIMDGTVAPPPIRQSFRVSALIPTNVATDGRRKKTKVGYSSKVEEDKEEEE